MLVILEGQARTGKTSVTHELIRRFRTAGIQARMFKSAVRSENPAEAIITQLLPLCFDDDCIWICDRAHITEQVYTLYNKRDRPYPSLMIARIDEIMAMSGSLLFYLVTETDILEQRMAATGRESEGSIEMIRYIFEMYIRQSAITKRTIDTTIFSIEQVTDMIFSAIAMMTAEGETDELVGTNDDENLG